MAILYTQAFDCDQNEPGARKIAQEFDGFEVDLADAGLNSIACEVSCYQARKFWLPHLRTANAADWWMVCINFPRLEQPATEKGLHVSEVMQDIRSKIYDKVKQVDGFRSAMFNCEAQDDLGDDDWITRLEKILSGEQPQFSGLILEKSLTVGRPIEPDVTAFSPGYLIYKPNV